MNLLKRAWSAATTCWRWLETALMGAAHWRRVAEWSAEEAAFWRESSDWWQEHAEEWQQIAERYKEQTEITEDWAEDYLRLRADHAATGAVLDEIIRGLAASAPDPPPSTGSESATLH